MFAKFGLEKVGSTVCQGVLKEQKRNSDIYKLSAEMETRTTTTRLKKRSAREQKKWNLLNFYNEKNQLALILLIQSSSSLK